MSVPLFVLNHLSFLHAVKVAFFVLAFNLYNSRTLNDLFDKLQNMCIVKPGFPFSKCYCSVATCLGTRAQQYVPTTNKTVRGFKVLQSQEKANCDFSTF